MIKVSIVEDLKEIAHELQELIQEEDGLSCEWVYYNGEDAVKFLPKHDIDIVIIDIGLPGISGVEVVQKLTLEMAETSFCMFTIHEDDEKIFNSLQAGAKGYILKNASPEKILRSIQELYHGGSPMSPSIARKIIDTFQKKNTKPEKPKNLIVLTKRENELLHRLAEGLLYKEIATKLGITLGTVKQHIHKIYEKLHVSNRTEAINRLRY